MAEPIPFTLPPRNARLELIRRLERAPQEHVEALLDAYAVLQLLRDKGLLEIAKGLLGSGEKVLDILTETIEKDDVIRTLRNLTILLKIVGSLDPEMLERIVAALAAGVTEAETQKPPGIFKLLGRLSGAKIRRVLVPAVAALESVGDNLARQNTARRAPKGKRRTVTRHRA
jgi:uncharacterized protein YjgD (DUF1641 family)